MENTFKRSCIKIRSYNKICLGIWWETNKFEKDYKSYYGIKIISKIFIKRKRLIRKIVINRRIGIIKILSKSRVRKYDWRRTTY